MGGWHRSLYGLTMSLHPILSAEFRIRLPCKVRRVCFEFSDSRLTLPARGQDGLHTLRLLIDRLIPRETR
jgi:hypothetical protein